MLVLLALACARPDAETDVDPGGCDPNVVGSDGLLTIYRDKDADGYGSPDRSKLACAIEDGWTARAEDCDDASPARNPLGNEVCNELDDDCDGLVDDADPALDATSAKIYWLDADGDGHGFGLARPLCAPKSGWSELFDDCDDSDPGVFPGAGEVCDGIDDDCDGLLEEADPGLLPGEGADLYVDADLDGYGGTTIVRACGVHAGVSAGSDDCDDTTTDAHPGAAEVCDEYDNDCDGAWDQNDPDLDWSTMTAWYLDGDADGFGGSTAYRACRDPSDWRTTFSALTDDCDDAEPAMNPGATEICDDLDNDCDGLVDGADKSVDRTSVRTWYADADGDGHGIPDATTTSCDDPSGTRIWALLDDDCDDTDGSVYPDAPERCDDLDNDCDASTPDLGPWVTTASGTVDGAADFHGTKDAPATVTLTDATLSFCGDGTVYANVKARNLVVDGNGATWTGGSDTAIQTTGSLDLEDLVIAGNDDTRYVFEVDGDLALDTVTVTDNTVRAAVMQVDGDVSGVDSTFERNAASAFGVILAWSGSVTFEDSWFEANTAGGAVVSSDELAMTGCVLIDNESEDGALDFEDGTIADTLVAGSIGIDAAAIRVTDSASITGSEIYGSSGAPAIYVENGTVECSGSGVFGNAGGAFHGRFWTARSRWLVTEGCDFGEGGLDNDSYDVWFSWPGPPSSTWTEASLGDDESVTCGTTGCE